MGDALNEQLNSWKEQHLQLRSEHNEQITEKEEAINSMRDEHDRVIAEMDEQVESQRTYTLELTAKLEQLESVRTENESVIQGLHEKIERMGHSESVVVNQLRADNETLQQKLREAQVQRENMEEMTKGHELATTS